MKVIARVLEVAQNGPVTSQDIADELGLSKKAASAYLSELKSCGVVEVLGTVVASKFGHKMSIYKVICAPDSQLEGQTCSCCQRFKDFNDFGRDTSRKSGRQRYCKACQVAKNRGYQKQPHIKANIQASKAKYIAANREKYLKQKKEAYARHAELNPESRRRVMQGARDRLADFYVRALLRGKSKNGFPISKEMVEAKRSHIQIERFLKELKK